MNNDDAMHAAQDDLAEYAVKHRAELDALCAGIGDLCDWRTYVAYGWPVDGAKEMAKAAEDIQREARWSQCREGHEITVQIKVRDIRMTVGLDREDGSLQWTSIAGQGVELDLWSDEMRADIEAALAAWREATV